MRVFVLKYRGMDSETIETGGSSEVSSLVRCPDLEVYLNMVFGAAKGVPIS